MQLAAVAAGGVRKTGRWPANAGHGAAQETCKATIYIVYVCRLAERAWPGAGGGALFTWETIDAALQEMLRCRRASWTFETGLHPAVALAGSSVAVLNAAACRGSTIERGCWVLALSPNTRGRWPIAIL